MQVKVANIMSTTVQLYSLEWFENVCLVILPKYPNEATKILMEFRSSSNALLAREYLLRTQHYIVKFQAALVLQYACILNWDSMAASDQLEFRNLIWSLIIPSSGALSNALPAYAVNKLIQIYALTWKKSWNSLSVAAKQDFFFSMYQLIQSTSKLSFQDVTVVETSLYQQKLIMQVLRILVEEFNSNSSLEKCLSLRQHKQLHILFETGKVSTDSVLAVGASGSGTGNTIVHSLLDSSEPVQYPPAHS